MIVTALGCMCLLLLKPVPSSTSHGLGVDFGIHFGLRHREEIDRGADVAAELDAAGCRIVTRLKSNTPLTVTAERKVPEAAASILSDRIGLLPRRQAGSRKTPFPGPLREVRVRIDTGKAQAVEGVQAVLTAEEVARDLLPAADLVLHFFEQGELRKIRCEPVSVAGVALAGRTA